MAERSALESEIIRKCLSRSELQCSFVEYRGYKVVYRRYARYEFLNKAFLDDFFPSNLLESNRHN